MQGWVQVNDGAKGLAKKKFQDIGLKFEKHRFQRCPNCFWQVICAKDKMDVESRPHFLFLGSSSVESTPCFENKNLQDTILRGTFIYLEGFGDTMN